MFYQQGLLLMLVYEPFCLTVSGIDGALIRRGTTNMRMDTFGELGRFREEVAVGFFRVLPHRLRGGTG
jgi:hypothetical protein